MNVLRILCKVIISGIETSATRESQIQQNNSSCRSNISLSQLDQMICPEHIETEIISDGWDTTMTMNLATLTEAVRSSSSPKSDGRLTSRCTLQQQLLHKII